MRTKLIIYMKKNIPFLFIICVAVLLRLYRLPEMASFDFDQEYTANFAWSVLREYPIQLIGQNLSIQGMFMGPLYFYFLTPFYFLFNLHPVGGAVGSVFIGILAVAVYYYAGNKIFGSPAGLIIAFFRAILYRKIEDDWSITPAFSSDLIVIITWLLFYQYWKGNNKILPIICFIFGLYTSFHPILFPFYCVFLFIFLLRKPLPNIKFIIIGGITFLIPIVPLIIFEYFHKFIELKNLIVIFSSHDSGISAQISQKILDLLTIIMSGPNQLLSLNLPVLFISSVSIILVVLITLKKIYFGKEKFHLGFLCLSIIIFVFYYLFFPANILGYYLSAPIVLILFYFGGLLGSLTVKPLGKTVVMAFICYVAFINIGLLNNRWSNSTLTTLVHKDNIVKEIVKKQPTNKDFFVSYISLPGWNFGFNYLFKVYGKIPKKDYVPNNSYTIVIPKNLSPDSINIYSGNVGLILSK